MLKGRKILIRRKKYLSSCNLNKQPDNYGKFNFYDD